MSFESDPGLIVISKSIPISTLRPALSSQVKTSLTSGYISIFGLIFLLTYIQLWMIWYYRHKRLSHQTLFLYMCLIWSGLRTSLFSMYYNECSTPNQYVVLYCLMYVFPVCLQFSMLCLLLHYFAQVVFKSRAKYEPRQYKRPLRIFLGLSAVIFTAMNMVFAVVTKHYETQSEALPSYFLYLRVSLTETMFLVYGILFAVCIFKMSTVAASRRVLEAKGTTVSRAVVASILITLLFLSRTVYNFISIFEHERNKMANFGYDWINVSDQVDDVTHLSEGLAYVSFGIVLFVWEVLPIFIVLVLFRVRRLQAGQVMTDFSAQNNGSRVFFFDNPRRYDSIDDLSSQDAPDSYVDANSTRSGAGDSSYRSFPGNGFNTGGLGSYPSPSHAYPSAGMPSYHEDFQRLHAANAPRGYGSINTSTPTTQSPHSVRVHRPV